MNEAMELINFFRNNGESFRIEVEGRESELKAAGIQLDIDGVRPLKETADKWSLEYRLYFGCDLPDHLKHLTPNSNPHIINNNGLIQHMLSMGCSLGDN